MKEPTELNSTGDSELSSDQGASGWVLISDAEADRAEEGAHTGGPSQVAAVGPESGGTSGEIRPTALKTTGVKTVRSGPKAPLSRKNSEITPLKSKASAADNAEVKRSAANASVALWGSEAAPTSRSMPPSPAMSALPAPVIPPPSPINASPAASAPSTPVLQSRGRFWGDMKAPPSPSLGPAAISLSPVESLVLPTQPDVPSPPSGTDEHTKILVAVAGAVAVAVAGIYFLRAWSSPCKPEISIAAKP